MKPIIKRDNKVSSIHILKALCAFLVVIIHTKCVYKDYFLPICRIAVPIFFMISGYFLLNKDRNCIEYKKIVKAIIKIVKIAFIANIIYGIAFYIFDLRSIGYLSFKFWIIEIFTGSAIVGHLWYLTAYIEVLLTIYFLQKINKLKILYYLIPCFIILNMLLGSYRYLIGIDHPYQFLHTNFLTIGLPCFAIGMLIKIYGKQITAIVKWWHVILCFIIAYSEGIIKHKMGLHPPGIGDIYLFTIPLAALTFIAFLKKKNLYCGQLIENIGEKHSLYIYLYHGLVLTLIVKYTDYSFQLPVIDALLIYLITILLSITSCNFAKFLQKIKQ